ncbi:MAG: DUF2975 domain-containing protein [Lentilactobacillus buchneri]|nr:DUF2975 domain-containing protein [Lentilactobacillus buchneri]MCI2019002.1 DUF2975 domain-containing protein [Lentilactobacillus buchneri]
MLDQNVSKSFLHLLYVLCLVVLAGYVIAIMTLAIIFGISLLVNLFDGKSFNDLLNMVTSYSSINLKNNLFVSLFTTILTVGLLVLHMSAFYLISQLLKDLSENQIFNDRSLHVIRGLNYSVAGIISIDGVSALLENIGFTSGSLSDGHSLSFEVLAWFTIYVIQVAFERGVQIKRENDSIV